MKQPVTSHRVGRVPAGPGYRAIYARLLCVELASRGIDPAAVLASAGLREADIGPAAAWVTSGQLGALITSARAACADRRLALAWGARIRNNVHGMAGTAFVSSCDVRRAISVFCGYVAVRASTLTVRVTEGGGTTWLEIGERSPVRVERDFLMAAIAAMLAELFGAVLGPGIGRLQIELPLPAAGWAEACAPYFPTTPRCGMPSLRFGIPNELLDLPCPTADTEAHAAAMRQCALDTLSLSGKLSERVAAYLAQQEGNYPTLHAMASDFCMSERSLSRNLQCEGVTYQGLLDEARQASAERYLVQTNLSIDQIAECLGYTDPSNFVRAFRRWVGMTPGAYRKGNS